MRTTPAFVRSPGSIVDSTPISTGFVYPYCLYETLDAANSGTSADIEFSEFTVPVSGLSVVAVFADVQVRTSLAVDEYNPAASKLGITGQVMLNGAFVEQYCKSSFRPIIPYYGLRAYKPHAAMAWTFQANDDVVFQPYAFVDISPDVPQVSVSASLVALVTTDAV
jgi:hypothetical protein